MTTLSLPVPSTAFAARRPAAALPMRLYRLTLALALKAALVIALLPAAPPSQAATPEAFAQATALFDRAGSDESSIEPAAERFAALSAAEPADPVLRAYAGASTAMRSRTTMLPWKKIGFAEDGLAQIDKALALIGPAHDAPAYRHVPAVLEARFTAASTFLALPSMFNRAERGAKLLDEVLKSPLFEPSPLPFKAVVWLRAGVTAAKAQRADDARRFLTLAAQSDTPVAAAAAAQLKAL